MVANEGCSSSKMDSPITGSLNFSPNRSRNPLSPTHNPPSTPTSNPKPPHSLQSSPGRLSLHDYRKLQTSPEAVRSSPAPARTLKRKGKASNLTATPLVPNPRHHPSRRDISQLTPSPTRPRSESFHEDSDLVGANPRPRARGFDHNRLSDPRRFGRVDLDVDFSTPSTSWIPRFPSPPLTPTPRSISLRGRSQKQLSRSRTYPYHHPSSSDPLPYHGKKAVTVHHRGTSFEIINPHDSLELLKITSAEDHPPRVSDRFSHRRHSSASLIKMSRNFSSNNPYRSSRAEGESSEHARPSTPRFPRTVFDDFPQAYARILDRNQKFPTGPAGTVDPHNPTAFVGPVFDIPRTPAHLIRPGPVTAQPWYNDNMVGVPYASTSQRTPPIMLGLGSSSTSKSDDSTQEAQQFDENVQRIVAESSKQPLKGRKSRGFSKTSNQSTEGNHKPLKGRKSRAFSVMRDRTSGDDNETGLRASKSPKPPKQLLSSVSTPKLSRLFSRSRSSILQTEDPAKPSRPLKDVTNSYSFKPKARTGAKEKSPKKITKRNRLKKRRTPRDHSTVSNIVASYGDDTANPSTWTEERQLEQHQQLQDLFKNYTFGSRNPPEEGGESSGNKSNPPDANHPTDPLLETAQSSGNKSDSSDANQQTNPIHEIAESSGNVGDSSEVNPPTDTLETGHSSGNVDDSSNFAALTDHHLGSGESRSDTNDSYDRSFLIQRLIAVGKSSRKVEDLPGGHSVPSIELEDRGFNVENSSDEFERSELFHPSHHSVQNRNRRLSRFDFGVNPLSQVPDESVEVIDVTSPAGEPPNIPLPPIPTRQHQIHGNDEGDLIDLVSSPADSTVSESYGNTRNLLNDSNRSDVRLSYVGRDGQTRSREVTLREARSLENAIKDHLRRVSESDTSSEYGNEAETHEQQETKFATPSRHSLSPYEQLKAAQTLPHHTIGAVSRPGGILRRSTALEERKEKRRSRQSQRARCLKNVTFKPSSVVGKQSSETDGDWETEYDSQPLPTADTQQSLATTESEGSLANYSSYGSLREEAIKGWSPLNDAPFVPQHPARSSFVHSHRLLRDMQTGRQVMIPEYLLPTGAFPDQNSLVEPLRVGEPAHHNPFFSSSPRLTERRAARWMEGTHELRVPEPALQRQLVGSKSRLFSRVGGDDQGTDLESLDRPSGVNESDKTTSSSQVAEQGSFSKVTTLGPKLNITGSPNGTGMRAVGSSMADYTASSEIDDLISSPFAIGKSRAGAARRPRGFPSPHVDVLSISEDTPLRFPEDRFPKAAPGFFHQEVKKRRAALTALTAQGNADSPLVPVYGAPPSTVHTSETNLIPLERASVTFVPRKPKKSFGMRPSKTSPSEEEIRKRIAMLDPIEMRDMPPRSAASRSVTRALAASRTKRLPTGRSTELMADGRPFSYHYDQERGHYVFSHSPRLVRREDVDVGANFLRQKKYGRWIVGVCSVVFFPGMIAVLAIACNLPQGSEMIEFVSGSQVRSFGRDEIVWARLVLFGVVVVAAVFAALAVTIGKAW